MSRDDEAEGHGFLGRWSRRKRRDANALPEDARREPPPEPSPEQPSGTDVSAESDAEILARLDLPDPETLGLGDDFARYLRAPLPMHLKRRALRRLWVSNPVLANIDGLNDYDTDFTGGSVPLGTLKTAYRIGRGFLADAVDSSPEDRTAHAPGESAGPVEARDRPPADCAEPGDDRADAEEIGEKTDEIWSGIPDRPEDPEEIQDYAAQCTKRRMAFRFDS